MRILILSVTAGGGHNRASEALRGAAEARGHEVLEQDLYRLLFPSAPGLTDRLYRFAAARLRRLYRRVYGRMEEDRAYRRGFEKLAMPRSLWAKTLQLLEERRPDAVLCTHVFAGRVLSDLMEEGKCSLPVLGLNTDYCLQPLWEDCPRLAGIVIPSEMLADACIARGVRQEQLLCTGLPLSACFREQPEKTSLRRDLGLQPDMPTVLLMGGSMGYGRLFPAAMALRRLPGVQTVCICGSNRLLKRLLQPFSGPGLKVLGYTREMHRWLAAADLAVTKPGGLSLTELLVQGLPPLLINPIPGHEDRNLRYFARHGLAFTLPNTRSGRAVARRTQELLADHEALEAVSRAMAAEARPRAAEDICARLESLDKCQKHDTI